MKYPIGNMIDKNFMNSSIKHTHLSVNEVRKRLENNIHLDGKPILRGRRYSKRSSKSIIGEATENGYRLILNEFYRSSVRPILDLSLQETKAGTDLHMDFFVYKFARFFLKMYVTGILYMLVFAVALAFFNEGAKAMFEVFAIVLPMLLFFGLIIFLFKAFYNREVKKLNRILCEMLDIID